MTRLVPWLLYGLAVCFLFGMAFDVKHALDASYAASLRNASGPPSEGDLFKLLTPALFQVAVLVALAEVLRLCIRIGGDERATA